MTRIAIVDIETTGKESIYTDLIVEIGIVELDLETGVIETLFDSIVKESRFEEKHSESWIFEISDLTFEDVDNAPPFNQFIPELQEIVDNYMVTSFNTEFDLGFLKTRGIRITNELPCIMKTATNICKIPAFWGGYKWPKMQEAWDFFFPSSDYIEAHRALDDAVHEAQILYEMYKEGQFPIRVE